jgi:hypothetical protein
MFSSLSFVGVKKKRRNVGTEERIPLNLKQE